MASKAKRAAKTATEALIILWEDGFFVGWQKKESIDHDLAGRGNNFNGAHLGMALKRAKHLTRRGKTGNYEYIQKYPHAVAAEKTVAKKKKTHGRKQ
jgi:hypothetical protein